MNVITCIEKIIPHLEEHIKKFGHRPEHQLYLFLYNVDPGYELIYFDFADNGGVVAHKKGKRWYIIDEPIAPTYRRILLIRGVLEYIFASGAESVSLQEWTGEFKKFAKSELLQNYQIFRPSLVQYCPVINLKQLDENLVGGHLKGLRYVRNHFIKNYAVEFKDAAEVSKDGLDSLLNLVSTWTSKRTAKDKVWAPDYIKFIQNGFPGCDIKRALFLDSRLCGLSAGWKIPNSESYYIYMDIHDYSDAYLGEFLSLDHILEVKKMGPAYFDFGGSDKNLFNFKKKFHPQKIYKIYDFSVRKIKSGLKPDD